jgi:DNA-binding response OmpR family regulator
MAKEILIVEDEGLIAGLISKNLLQKGYEIAVLEPRQVLKQARKHRPSLIILDAPSSETAAAETCRHLHDVTSAPIVALTESPFAWEELEGVSYLPKPPDFRELLTVVESNLSVRRKRKKRIVHFLRLGDLVLDLQTHRLIKGEMRHRLTPKEFLLLKMFMDSPGRVLSHKAIMKEVWDTSYLGDTRTLYVHVSWIRQKIEEEPRKPVILRTVRGVGYRFEVKS